MRAWAVRTKEKSSQTRSPRSPPRFLKAAATKSRWETRSASAHRTAPGADREVAEHIPIDALAGHFHDTYGQALANIYAALTWACMSSTPRSAGWADVPTRLEPPAMSPPKTCSTCSMAWASRPASISTALLQPGLYLRRTRPADAIARRTGTAKDADLLFLSFVARSQPIIRPSVFARTSLRSTSRSKFHQLQSGARYVKHA